jgi:hypothetical protein
VSENVQSDPRVVKSDARDVCTCTLAHPGETNKYHRTGGRKEITFISQCSGDRKSKIKALEKSVSREGLLLIDGDT